MGTRHLKQHCKLNDESQELIRVAMTQLNLSARAYNRILKVARTVADFEPLATTLAATSGRAVWALDSRGRGEGASAVAAM